MALVTNNFDGGTDGAGTTGGVTTGNSANSGSALNTITIPTATSATFNYDATGAAAGLGGRWQLSGATTGWRAYHQWTAAGTSLAARWAFCFNTLPSSNVTIGVIINGSFATSLRLVYITATTLVQVQNAAGAVLGSSSAISGATVYGLEAQMDCGSTTTNGTINAQLYAASAPGSLLLNYSSGGATVNAGGGSASPQPIRGSMGNNDIVASLDLTFDALAFNPGSATAIGPPLVSPSAAVAASTAVPPSGTEDALAIGMTIRGF